MWAALWDVQGSFSFFFITVGYMFQIEGDSIYTYLCGAVHVTLEFLAVVVTCIV